MEDLKNKVNYTESYDEQCNFCGYIGDPEDYGYPISGPEFYCPKCKEEKSKFYKCWFDNHTKINIKRSPNSLNYSDVKEDLLEFRKFMIHIHSTSNDQIKIAVNEILEQYRETFGDWEAD